MNIYPGNATINNQLIVGSNVGVGGDMFVGSNVTISGNLVANNITGNITVNANINITSPSSTIAVTSNIAGSVFTLDVSGTVVRNISGFFGDVGITNTDGTVLITSNGNGFSFDTCTNAILPMGTNYGDYLFWDGSAFAVGDTQVSIGGFAGSTNQSTYGIAVGYQAGESNQRVGSIAVGYQAGQISQGNLTVAIGYLAGQSNQGGESLAIGYSAGQLSQGGFATTVGYLAGQSNQGCNSVAIGAQAGNNNQSTGSVAVGYQAGYSNQAANAVAIGYQAGNTSQGANSIAIGATAGYLDQPANSIVLNATGVSLSTNTVGFFVSPLRNVSATSNLVAYDPLTTEIGYTSITGGNQWSTFPAVSPIDTQNFDITTSIGSVNISGDTNFLGSDVSITALGSIAYCNVTGSNTFTVGTAIGPGYTSVKVEMWGAGGGTGGVGVIEGQPGGGGYVVFQTDVSDATIITAIAGTAGNNSSTQYGGASSTRGGGAAGGDGVSRGGGGGGGASILSIDGTVYGIAGGGGGSAPNYTYVAPSQGIYNAFYSIGGNAGSTANDGYAIIQTSQNGSLPIFTRTGGEGGASTGSGRDGGSGYGTGGANANGSRGVDGADANTPGAPTNTALGGSGGIGTLAFAYGGGGGGGGYGGGGGGGASMIGNLGYIVGYTIASAGGGGGSSYIRAGTSNDSNYSPSSTQGNPAFLCTVPSFTTRGYAKNDGFIRLTFYNSTGAHAVTSLVTIPDGSIQAQEFNSGKFLLPSLISNASAYVFSFSNLRSGTLAAGLYKTCAYSYDASSSDYSYSTVLYDYGGTAHMINNSSVGTLQESIRGASDEYWLSNINGAFNYGNIMVSVTKIG